MPFPIFLQLCKILDAFISHPTFVDLIFIITDSTPHLKRKVRIDPFKNEMKDTCKGLIFFIVWTVAIRSENSEIDERHCYKWIQGHENNAYYLTWSQFSKSLTGAKCTCMPVGNPISSIQSSIIIKFMLIWKARDLDVLVSRCKVKAHKRTCICTFSLW